MNEPTNPGLGEIRPDSLYSLHEIQRRLGWTAHSLRAARRQGLTIHYAGKRGYLLGAEVIRHVTSCPTIKPGCTR
jgi:hypothetical protein